MNRLSEETSPYLLQHASNPVDWYAWKEEAFERARKEDKPILVSIGYSTCHWCHVMERESFEDPEIAAFMNENFINIKVDREERPDIDQIYMDACQAINGNGGWPLNCFLTPDKRPYYAGTYFPPRSAHNRPSWIQVLKNITNAFHNKREVVEEQADRLLEAIKKSDKSMVNSTIEGLEGSVEFTKELSEQIFYNLRDRFDRIEGGFGGAPKFPGTMTLRFLLNYHYFTKNEEALNHALFSLDKMISGGIYDQLGGGFARYATDRAWLVPHFEKMLYDNALLVELLADAYKLTKKELYQETIIETLDFVEREMTNEQGAFYSALDADSEGVEGKYYVWSKAEIEEILGQEADLFCRFYDIIVEGNWEETNILQRKITFEEFAVKERIEVEDLKLVLQKNRSTLLKVRSMRIRPGLDDKILLSWNALQCSAYASAYAALGIEKYKIAAIKNIRFLLSEMIDKKAGLLFHTYKNGKAQYHAFLEDYAYLIKALLDVYRITFDESLLAEAERYLFLVQQKFFDNSDGLFYFTSEQQQDIIVRKKEIFDSAMPSGNSTMVGNLVRMGLILNNEGFRIIAEKMLLKIKKSIENYPSSFSRWASELLNQTYTIKEIAVLGPDASDFANEINKIFIPGSLLMASTKSNNKYQLLENRFSENETLIYLCENYSCQRPVKSVEDFEKQLMES